MNNFCISLLVCCGLTHQIFIVIIPVLPLRQWTFASRTRKMLSILSPSACVVLYQSERDYPAHLPNPAAKPTEIWHAGHQDMQRFLIQVLRFSANSPEWVDSCVELMRDRSQEVLSSVDKKASHTRFSLGMRQCTTDEERLDMCHNIGNIVPLDHIA